MACVSATHDISQATVLKLVRRLVGEHAVPSHMFPRSWLDPSRSQIPLLELHVLPYEDSVSNSVRTTNNRSVMFLRISRMLSLLWVTPLCAAAYLAQMSSCCRSVWHALYSPWQLLLDLVSDSFFWQVGASLDVCTLWAFAILQGLRSHQVHLKLEARRFEPAPYSA